MLRDIFLYIPKLKIIIIIIKINLFEKNNIGKKRNENCGQMNLTKLEKDLWAHVYIVCVCMHIVFL